MSTPYNDIAQLEETLRDVASQLDPQHLPQGEPTGDWRHHLAGLNGPEDNRFALLVPSHPQIEELLACDKDDATFVESLYHHLLGRESDPEGHAYYRQETAESGRLFVLCNIIRSAPAQEHMAQQGIQLPPGLQRWVRLHALACRSGGQWGRLKTAAWRRTLRAVSRLNERRWANTASLYRMLARNNKVAQAHTVIANALLEIDQRQQSLQNRQQHESARQGSLWQQMAELRRQSAPRSQADTALTTPPQAAASPVTSPSTKADPRALDAYYLAFEDAFRGEETRISEHLEGYRAIWTRARQAGRQALDLGCGRGEWLRLLDQAGFEAHGIDLNTTMVAHCQARGFAVEHQDALAALQQQADDSHALISGFHIAEHLPFEVLFQLVDEAYRVLKPGGVLILETPNPENLIVASYSFYHDLTHLNPLTPVTLEFLYQFQGFQPVEILRLNPPPESSRIEAQSNTAHRLNHMLMAPMDYAVIGTKGTPQQEAAP